MHLFLLGVKSRKYKSEGRRASAEDCLLMRPQNVNELWESNSYKVVKKWKLK